MLEVVKEEHVCYYVVEIPNQNHDYGLFEVVRIELFDEFSLHFSKKLSNEDTISKIEVRDCGTFSSPCLSVLCAAQSVVRKERIGINGTLRQIQDQTTNTRTKGETNIGGTI